MERGRPARDGACNKALELVWGVGCGRGRPRSILAAPDFAQACVAAAAGSVRGVVRGIPASVVAVIFFGFGEGAEIEDWRDHLPVHAAAGDHCSFARFGVSALVWRDEDGRAIT